MYFLVFFFPALTYALLYILIRLGFNFSRRDAENIGWVKNIKISREEQNNYGLQPALSFEIDQKQYGHEKHESPKRRIGPWPIILRLEFEVHSIYTGDESERDENRGDHRENFHHIGHAIGHFGHKQIMQGGQMFILVVIDVHDLHDIVHDVAKIPAGLVHHETIVGP